MNLDLLVRNGLICTEDAPPTPGCLGARDGRIVVLAETDTGLDAAEVIDAAGRLVMPGMVDPHGHIGHGAPHASEFWTEGSSAGGGGVTTLPTFYRRHPFLRDLWRGVTGTAQARRARSVCAIRR